MTNHHFRPKRYGYGLYPVTWQGWMLTLALVGVLLVAAYVDGIMGPTEPTMRDVLRFLLDAGIITTLFMMLTKDRCEGGLKWRWGNK